MQRLLLDAADAIVNPRERSLTDDERFAVSNLLCQAAQGNDVRDPLRINKAKAGHRRRSSLPYALALEVRALILGGAGVTAACRAVAEVAQLDLKTVQGHWRQYKAGRLR